VHQVVENLGATALRARLFWRRIGEPHRLSGRDRLIVDVTGAPQQTGRCSSKKAGPAVRISAGRPRAICSAKAYGRAGTRARFSLLCRHLAGRNLDDATGLRLQKAAEIHQRGRGRRLVDRAKTGDVWCSRRWSSTESVAFTLAPRGGRPCGCQDIAQEAFLKAYRGLLLPGGRASPPGCTPSPATMPESSGESEARCGGTRRVRRHGWRDAVAVNASRTNHLAGRLERGSDG
jgi:hypothetical protein